MRVAPPSSSSPPDPAAVPAPGARRSRLDRAGAVASSACAVHCVLCGIFLGGAAVLPAFARDERLETLLFLIAAALALASIVTGYPRHRRRTVVFLALGGISVLAAGRALEDQGVLGVVASILGALLLIAGHLLSARLLDGRSTCSVAPSRAVESS